jgi:hypothetical protein
MDLCHDASRISESLEGLKMKREVTETPEAMVRP